MGNVSQKCLYGIRALFELSKHWEDGTLVKLHRIAEAQSIPKRFLENILNQLRQGEFVESRRGKEGGFRLGRSPELISVGDIIRFIDTSLFPVSCAGENPSYKCPLKGSCVFMELWENALRALESVYDAKSLRDLVEDEKRYRAAAGASASQSTFDCVASLPVLEAVRCGMEEGGEVLMMNESKGVGDVSAL